MNTSSSLEKVILKSGVSRRFPDPLNNSVETEPYNIEHHILLVKAHDVPSGISLRPNPRAQRIDVGIYKDIQASLEDAGDLTFHLKNKGITMFAQKIEVSEDKKVVTAFLGPNDGIADGGHTYEIVLDSQRHNHCPANQYVKFEIVTGIPERNKVDIVGGLNTAVQVQDASLENLQGAFEWIKKALEGMPYAGKIGYKQNENKDFDIRDVISFLVLFNVEHPSLKGRSPKEAYTSKSACLNLYKDKPETFEMLKPILKDILYLHDYIHIHSGKIYNKETGGKSGLMKGVFDVRERGKFKFIFMDEESDRRLFDGTLFPIFGAMRYLVEVKPGKRTYSWKLNSFEDVKRFFDGIAADMITTTYNTSVNYGRKPNAVGKDDNHWNNLYKTVALHFFESALLSK